MSFRISLASSIVLASLAARAASAQQTTVVAPHDTNTTKTRAVQTTSTDSAIVELGRALTALAASVQTAVEQTAKSPEVRRAALQTAGKAVSLSQRALEENTGEIERLLAEASRRLGELDASQKAKAERAAKPGTSPAPTAP
jgi:hypothetical protein